MRKLLLGLVMLSALGLRAQPPAFHTVTLEMSLKPFKKKDRGFWERTADTLFRQWRPLLEHADTVAIMLWTGDGSEILDYSGRLTQTLSWAKFMGNPNTNHAVGSGPASLSLHERAYLYIQHPPEYNYGDLKAIIQVLRQVGGRITGKPIRIGATFDPGPEFAISDFKYTRHREILGGNAMGKATFVSCYSVLHGDTVHYAGWPRGIPDKTPFGTFFGRQCQYFLKDLGYDYLWLSNGFGFGVEGWSSTGAIFNGKGFDTSKMAPSQEKIAGFWKLFRRECPGFGIQTRGTNLSTGIDLARDAVNLKAIYSGGYGILPPPNSPWAALDGDFGLELTGYMSRISSLPDERYLFRYYTHDPWWVNSPWLDRYGREPHDIYLPSSVARIDQRGRMGLPTQLNLLTVDNSYGDMPAQVPEEVIPHLLAARRDAPDAPGPLVWVYPFDEYHEMVLRSPARIGEVYYGDWLIRQAINNGFPLNTVMSTTSFAGLGDAAGRLLRQSIVVTTVPEAGSAVEARLIEFVQGGGRLLVYGPAEHIGSAFAKLLNLGRREELEGVFKLAGPVGEDGVRVPDSVLHERLWCGGGVSTVVADPGNVSTKLLARYLQGGASRDVAWERADASWKGGKVVYVRGTNSAAYFGGHLLSPQDASVWYTGGLMLRQVLGSFGLRYSIDKGASSIKNPVLSIARHDNAFYFSGYVPNTTVRQRFKLPQGVPVFTGLDALMERGEAAYYLPPAWHRECRVFVEQDSGVVSLREVYSGDRDISRRIVLSGLQHATVRFYAPAGIDVSKLRAYVNAEYPWQKGQVSLVKGDISFGECYELRDVTGNASFAW